MMNSSSQRVRVEKQQQNVEESKNIRQMQFQVEPIRNFFAALFLANIGMLIHVYFLWDHIDILLAAIILVIVINTLVVTTVVKGFQYNNKTSLLVGMSLAQIGEFAFVLLSRASNVHLVEGKLYLLLLGTTALSLAMFIPSAEALDTSYFMSNYVWNPDDENVGGGSDFDDMTEACSISCSCASCYTQDEDVGYAMSYTYSGEASEEFDRDDNTLTLIKPSAMPSKDIRSPLEVGSLHGGNNGVSNSDLEEDKTK